MLNTEKKELSPDIDEDVNDIKNPSILIQRGRRSMNLGDYEDSVQSFSRATALLVSKHGDLGYECGEAYLGYGKALLEHYRQKCSPIEGTAFNESSLMSKYTKPMFVEEQYDDDKVNDEDNTEQGAANSDQPQEGSSRNAHKKKKESASEISEENVAKVVEDAIGKTFDEEKKIIKTYLPSKLNKLFIDEKDSEKSSEKELDEKDKDKDKDKEEKVQTQQEGPSEQDQVEDEDQEDDEEIDVDESEVAVDTKETEDDSIAKEENDLELAWESLEVAKTIFNGSDKNDKTKHFLAETLIALGDISLENEQYNTAIEDMKKGLDLMTALHSTDFVVHRDLAEAVFKLGTAYLLNFEINNAINCFNKSKSYLNDRLQEIKRDTMEHAEIVKIIQEIDEKIADSVDMKNNIMAATKKELGCSSGANECPTVSGGSSSASSSSTSTSTSTSTRPNDITHLVKRRRPDDNGDSMSDNNPPKQFKAG